MCNPIIQVCEKVVNLNQEETDWLDKILSVDDSNEQESLWLMEELDVNENAIKCWPDFDWEIEPEDNVLLTIDGSGSIDQIANLMRAFLEKFRPDSFFTLTYSVFCSPKMPGELFGGAFFVTADDIQYTDAKDWLYDREREFLKNRKNYG
jgi:hypothetical protein